MLCLVWRFAHAITANMDEHTPWKNLNLARERERRGKNSVGLSPIFDGNISDGEMWISETALLDKHTCTAVPTKMCIPLLNSSANQSCCSLNSCLSKRSFDLHISSTWSSSQRFCQIWGKRHLTTKTHEFISESKGGRATPPIPPSDRTCQKHGRCRQGIKKQ